MNYENSRPSRTIVNEPSLPDVHYVKRADYYDARNPFLTDFHNTYPFNTQQSTPKPWHDINPFAEIRYYQISDHRGAFSMEW